MTESGLSRAVVGRSVDLRITMQRYDFSPFSILIVDDNQLIRHLVAHLCRGFGFTRVREVADGSRALSVMRETEIDIVISDWMMEPMSGYDFTHFVRTSEESPNPFVPIIMLTGHTEVGRIEMARDVGVTEFLAKPVSPRTLLDRLIHVIEHPRTFVRSPGYTGPDRRRAQDPNYAGPERRRAAQPESDVNGATTTV